MTKILFVCHGNICRSVMAQYIFTWLSDRQEQGRSWYADSAATSSEDVGKTIYPPARKVLQEHRIPVLSHRARLIQADDFRLFDCIVGMDRENMESLHRLFGGGESKIKQLLPWEIPDPWYTKDFESAYRDILEGCRLLPKRI